MASLDSLFRHLNGRPSREESLAYLLAMIRVAADAMAQDEEFGENFTPLHLMVAGTRALGDLGVTDAELASATLNVLGGDLPAGEKEKLQRIAQTGKI